MRRVRRRRVRERDSDESGMHGFSTRIQRPKEWDEWSPKQRATWLAKQRTVYKGGRKKSLKKADRQRVWDTLQQSRGNITLASETLGVSRSTLTRYLKENKEWFERKSKGLKVEVVAGAILTDKGEPIDVEEYPEMKIWYSRQLMYSKKESARHHLVTLRKFYAYQLKHHPERARPKLWTTDDMIEFLQTYPIEKQKGLLDGLRSVALKAPKQFPDIDVVMLPTGRAFSAKRTRAGLEEFYVTPQQISMSIENVPYTSKFEKLRNEAMIATGFNTAIRTGDYKENRGLVGMRIENIHVDEDPPYILVRDKGRGESGKWWLVYGLTSKTCSRLNAYIEERNRLFPNKRKKGHLWLKESGQPVDATEFNEMFRTAGERAGIKGKGISGEGLSGVVFRKSFVKYALESEVEPSLLIGQGKGSRAQPKTCLCVGWTGEKGLQTIMEHYAPKRIGKLRENREKLKF